MAIWLVCVLGAGVMVVMMMMGWRRCWLLSIAQVDECSGCGGSLCAVDSHTELFKAPSRAVAKQSLDLVVRDDGQLCGEFAYAESKQGRRLGDVHDEVFEVLKER